MNTEGADGSPRFLNRELSWLAFNERVLEEARDPDTPLLERFRFAAIAASNLDEFFMVRVAALTHAVEAGEVVRDLSGLSPEEQLAAVAVRTHALVDAISGVVTKDLLPSMAREQLRILSWQDLGPAQLHLGAYFRDAVLPVLTPLAIDEARPFPLLSSLSLNLALLLEAGGENPARRLAIVQVPGVLPRLVPIPGLPGHAYVLLEDLIRAHLSQLFPGQTVLEATVIRLSRDAEIELDDEGGRSHLEVVEREVRRRRRSDVIRLEMESTGSAELQALLCERLDLSPRDLYVVHSPLDLRGLLPLTDVPGLDRLRYPPFQPADVLAETDSANLFAVLDERDVLLHHPYESYGPVVALIEQAAEDPDVLAIKQTLYRTSTGSPIIAGLQRAAEAGKQVTVLVELTARFDEERNIKWARALEEAGAHVIYGVRGYKTHAKVCLIVRRTPQGLRRYVHLGTGNYNERTARIYTDFGLMTSSRTIAEDATAFFSALTGYSDPPKLKKLAMAPTALRRRFSKLIDRERRRAEAGQPAEIVAKMNSLIDKEIIESLYTASQAGVRIRLNVRGICALRPGIPGVSDTIEVVSVVDRFLEHSRIYYFLNGGEEQVYLASADLMTRNLDKRVELLFPVEQPANKATVIHALRAMFRDTVKARTLRADGTYVPVTKGRDEAACRVQQMLLEEAQRRVAYARERAGVTFKPARAAPSI
jgi:polyphosphate kinase